MPRIRDREESFDIPDGEVFIHLAGHPDIVWDMTGNSRQAGGKTVLWRRHGAANQRWRLTVFNDETPYYTWFRIINVNSGMALVHQEEGDAFVQQPLSEEDGWSQVWAMGYPGFSGPSGYPAKPPQPHPTGSDGVRLRFQGDGPGKLAIAAPESTGTNLSSNWRWADFETGWKFVAAS